MVRKRSDNESCNRKVDEVILSQRYRSFHDVFSLTVETGSSAAPPRLFFPQLNLHRRRVRRKLDAHVQTALPDARRALRLTAAIPENAPPVKR
jgi:hypothetical protein